MPRIKSKRFSIRLPILLTFVFTSITVSVGGYIGHQHYQRSKQLILDQTHTLVDAFSDEFVLALEQTYRPINTVLEILSYFSGTAAEATAAERLAQLPLLVGALKLEPQIRAIMTAQKDGRFFIVRHIRNPAALKSYRAPPDTQYIVDDIYRAGDKRMTRRLFLSEQEATLEDSVIGEATFDPRSRPWYQLATQKPGLQTTAPYPYFQTGEPGITLAKEIDHSGRVLAADLTLEDLSRALRRKTITPGTQLALVNAQGQILAYSHDQILNAGRQGAAALNLTAIEHTPFAPIAEALLSADESNQTYDYHGARWLGLSRTLNPNRADSARILIAVPMQELMAEAEIALLEALRFTGLALLLSIPLVWGMAHSITRPISRLVREAFRIRHFDFTPGRPPATALTEIQRLGEAMTSTSDTISRFLNLISSLAGETRFDRLLQTVNRETISACQADAGLLFLLHDNARRLKAVDLAFAEKGAAEVDHIVDADPDDSTDVVGRVYRENRYQILDLKRQNNGQSERFASLFQHLSVDHLHLMLLPLANRQKEVSGVLCLAFTPDGLPLESLEERAAFARSLSGFAAVTIESQYLISMQKKLLDSIIQLLAGAIDAKSPYTGGHCQRVPVLTQMLAKAACESSDNRFEHFTLNDKEWEAVTIASWLHDCGKITTPEYVVDKATKLEALSDRIHEIRMRFEVIKQQAWIDYYRACLKGEQEILAAARRDEALSSLDEDFIFVAQCNLGTEQMPEADIARLHRIAARTWTRTLDDRVGISWEEAQRKQRSPAQSLPVEEPLLADRAEHLINASTADSGADAVSRERFNLVQPLHHLNRGELYNLSIRKGTLTAEERFIINDHIVQTILMLERLPFPRHLSQVPALAGGHHEKMDGTGYPLGLVQHEMPLVARMMAIADIFEALTASDRPYKTPKTLSESLRIMQRMSREKHIDRDLFTLFVRSGVYQRYAEAYLKPGQIDEVSIESLLRET
ncbi:MAG: hypothetical protein IPM37_17750 [Hahellaceae bacterium]|nr:hypothetical protein [Hahellaceae bacterium]